jgi:hypothetical protein
VERLAIAATSRSPEISFDFDRNVFAIKGESYPEDVTEFYGPLVEQLTAHFARAPKGGAIVFRFELVYFNSSTAKIILGLFTLLEEAAGRGTQVTITWAYEEGDDNVRELGEEFSEELSRAAFVAQEVPIA